MGDKYKTVLSALQAIAPGDGTILGPDERKSVVEAVEAIIASNPACADAIRLAAARAVHSIIEEKIADYRENSTIVKRPDGVKYSDHSQVKSAAPDFFDKVALPRISQVAETAGNACTR